MEQRLSTKSGPDPLGVRLGHVHNARDLGGIPTADGVIRAGRLLRSASLASASADDVAVLQHAGVREVVDLRADWELATAGVVPSAFTTHRLVLVPDADRVATHDVLRTEGLPGYYTWILGNARARLVELVQIIAGADDGVLIQCGAGKDRTGVTVAVLLDLLGVGDADIAADYARTAAALRSIRSDLMRTPGYERAISELPREALGAPADAILESLRGLRTSSGSVRDHLVAGGLDPADVRRLQDRLVVAPQP